MKVVMAYSIFLGGAWAVSGLAYIISIIVKRKDSNLAAVVAILTMCLFSGQAPQLSEMRDGGSFMIFAFSSSFGRYLYEAIWIAEVQQWPEVWCPNIDHVFDDVGLKMSNYEFCVMWLWILGFIFRAIAYFCLVSTRATEQQREWFDECCCSFASSKGLMAEKSTLVIKSPFLLFGSMGGDRPGKVSAQTTTNPTNPIEMKELPTTPLNGDQDRAPARHTSGALEI
jgi:hypothetical protein